MKGWQIFAVGVAALVAAILFQTYERLLAGLAAVFIVAVVILGFLLKPIRDTFYLRATLVVSKPDCALGIEHDRVAIRVELARLWLLFLPTFAAVGLLVVTSARGTTWGFSLLDRLWEMSPSYFVYLMIRGFLVLVVGLLSAWISERWVLRNAEACSADSVSTKTGALLYCFKDSQGGYYGGEGFPYSLVRSPKLARIVFLSVRQPAVQQDCDGLPVSSSSDHRTRDR